ncbi:MAG: META domain-containing protein [Deltaproteobacteria bacterium]|nr:META domain-containing protein [Deltaproteobacteria bacterium]
MKLYATVMTVFGLLSVLACAGTQSGGTGTKTDAMQITPQRIDDISGIEWHLTKMKMADKSISLIENSKTTFSCDEDGKVAGVATINRYFGNFNLKENGDIVWNKAFGMTRMAGPPELMEQEAAFMRALPQTARLYLKASKLILISKDKSTTLEFAKIDN